MFIRLEQVPRLVDFLLMENRMFSVGGCQDR
jgi:hypothetical protein